MYLFIHYETFIKQSLCAGLYLRYWVYKYKQGLKSSAILYCTLIPALKLLSREDLYYINSSIMSVKHEQKEMMIWIYIYQSWRRRKGYVWNDKVQRKGRELIMSLDPRRAILRK